MIYVILGTGLLFGLIGVIVNETNAKYLLAGYNTMSDEERSKVDIVTYIKYFRKFHLVLSISFMVFGWLFLAFVSEQATLTFIISYPILLYIFFLFDSQKYIKGGISSSGGKIASAMLIFSLITVLGLLYWGFQDNKVAIDDDQVRIKGPYGKTIPVNQVQSVQWVNDLPEISIKLNGLSVGRIKKGLFKTTEGEKVWLILNAESPENILQISLKDKKPTIFYTTQDYSIPEELLKKLEQN